VTGGARPDLAALADLVRLPAVLSVPGDTLLGVVAAGGSPPWPRRAGLVAASSCLYLGGMALNDYADRDVDAVERPHRPIPSGRVDARVALRVAQTLTVAGVGTAALAGGARALAVAVPLAASVWSYDLALKSTPWGPAAMATCRTLDVLLGASTGSLAPALVPAGIIGAHTLVISVVSRSEATGSAPSVPRAALAGTVAVTAAAAGLAARRRPDSGRIARAGTLGSLAAYVVPVGGAARAAVAEPGPRALQRFVGAGVLGMVPLQAGLIAAAGAPAVGAAVGALWPVARRLARRRAVT
jgi:4-hydroxybenzoate polyprenyltransferase